MSDLKPAPFGGSGLGNFVYLRTYSRWLDDKMRRENWAETVQRVVDYSMSLYQGSATQEELQQEANLLFDHIYNLKLFPAGRTLWVGGTEAAKKFGTANFNCAFTIIDNLQALCDVFHLLMVGSGVGFRILKSDIEKLPQINTKIATAHKPYNQKIKAERIEYTQKYEEDNSVYIIVGDSKAGWVQALEEYLKAIQRFDVETIIINYDSVRPKGESLKTFGGRASGHQALRDMFKGIHKIVRNIKTNQFKPIDILDIVNLIGYNVVVGGVRRTSEICLFSPDDTEVLNAKLDLYVEGTQNYGKFWRSMSNNSIFYEYPPSKTELEEIFKRIMNNGEPGFVNAQAARKRRPWFEGINPCAEILLDNKGVCNLTEVNVRAFVINGKDGPVLDIVGLEQAVRLATRIGLRQTNITLDLPEWDFTQKRDRLTGVSLTGLLDAFDALDFSIQEQAAELEYLNTIANVEAVEYAKQMRIPTPLLVTTVKPSGTLSQLPTVSSGVHRSFAPHFIRRVRISSSDPLAKVMLDLGYPIYPENGQGPTVEQYNDLSVYDQMEALKQANTWVVEFPVKTSAKMAAMEENAIQQFDRYLMMQQNWTDHNTSITIYFDETEVNDLIEVLLNHWDEYIAISFLPKYTTAYPLLPYEEISEQEYDERSNKLTHISSETVEKLLIEYERENMMSELLDTDCASGACPIR